MLFPAVLGHLAQVFFVTTILNYDGEKYAADQNEQTEAANGIHLLYSDLGIQISWPLAHFANK